jgi:hypothetical protein
VVACSEWAKVGANQHGGCKPGLHATAEQMAKDADVSRQTIQQAKVANADHGFTLRYAQHKMHIIVDYAIMHGIINAIARN